MRILSRKIISPGKRSHHRRMRCIIPKYRKTGIQNSIFHMKNIKHHPCNKYSYHCKQNDLFSENPLSGEHSLCHRENILLFFLKKNCQYQCCHSHNEQISIKKRMFCPRTYTKHPGNDINCPCEHQNSCSKSCRQYYPYPVSIFSRPARKQTPHCFHSC